MRTILILYLLTCGYQLFGQYDKFDFELGYDNYKDVYSRFKEEKINGTIKELKRYSNSKIQFHIELNSENQIIKEYEYSDTLKLSRTKIYADKKLIKETEYRDGIPTNSILYKYDKFGNLTSKDFLTKKRLTTRITYQYDNLGRLLIRSYGNNKGFDQFIYDGDTVNWKLVFNEFSVLKSVVRKIRREKMELITVHKLDTTSDVHFTKRIKPTREYYTKWDNNKNIIETGEFEYDADGDKSVLSFKVDEFNANNITKSISTYNTDLLKGEFTTEYLYDSLGHLESEISKRGNRVETIKYQYDSNGNCTSKGSFIYKFLYDAKGNWIEKQQFHPKNSISLKTDTWKNEEKRMILYFD
jgi:hypothetical protein